MALATTSDLEDYGVVLADYDATLLTRLLNAASVSITEAAGSQIVRHTATVPVTVHRGETMRVPGNPIVSVTEIVRDRDDYTMPQGGRTGWRLLNDHVYLPGGWTPLHQPEKYWVTREAGLTEVPDDIVDLTVSLVMAALAQLNAEDSPEEAFGARDTSIAGKSFQIDDYSESVSYQQGAGLTERQTVFDLPDRTRKWLRRRFGKGGVSQWP